MKKYMLMAMLMVGSVAINGMDADAWMATPTLPIAAGKGNLVAVRELLTEGADVSYAQDDGTTSLMAAARKGHLEVCRELIAHNANVFCVNRRGITPLMMAAKRGSQEICELLVRKMLFGELFEKVERQKEAKAKMAIFLGCCKRTGFQYHNIRQCMNEHRHPALIDNPRILERILELRRTNEPRVLAEINKMANGSIKTFLLTEYFNQ